MKAVLDWFASPGCAHLVFSLLDSLWLGVLWACLLAVALRGAGQNAERRYACGVCSLAGLMLSVLLAWAIRDHARARTFPPHEPSMPALVQSSDLDGPAESPPSKAESAGLEQLVRTESHASWTAGAALVWFAGLVLMLARLAAGIVESGRVGRSSLALDDPLILRLCNEARVALGISRVIRVVVSSSIMVPAVTGVIWPVILIPGSLLTGAAPEQLRAILLHELAHIRRHDFLVNLFQQIIEAALFFNPAVWWINRQIRVEREACCDALAIRVSMKPGEYAAALVDFAGRLRVRPHSLEMAFPGDNQPSTLLERVRRILAREYQPVARLPWYSFALGLVCAGLCLIGAWRGSKFAVAVAAGILSPEQRIQRIADLKSANGPEDRTYTDADKIRIEGSIRTSDGRTLKGIGLQLHVHVENPRESYGFGPIPLHDGHFDQRIKFGTIHLAAWASEGYGPALVGPLRAKPGGSLTNLELVLPVGFPAGIHVTDKGGNPLPGVQLEGLYQLPTGAVPIKLVTDTSGNVVVEHCVDFPMRWTAALGGFQASEREGLRLRDKEPYAWQLQPARVTTGQVLNRTDHQPVSGARIKLVYRSGGPTYNLSSATLLTTTDARGMFRLDSLPDNAMHILAVEAPGCATKLARDVTAGQEGLAIDLGPEIILSGRIEGDLSRLNASGKPAIYASNPLQIGSSYSSLANRTVPVVLDGDVARFAISNLCEGAVEITAGGTTFKEYPTESKRDLVLRLPEIPRQIGGKEDREIIVRLEVPPGAPPVKGQLAVTLTSPDSANSRQIQVPIVENEARFAAPLHGWVSWTTKGLIGYWIREQMGAAVPEESGALILRASAFPAGAIHGSVRDSDGSEIGGVMLTILEPKVAPERKAGPLGQVGKDSASPNDGPTRFVAQPLPLGGEYVVLASRGKQFVASERIALSKNDPIREVDLRFVPGKDLSGVIIDEHGAPLSRIPISLRLETSFSHAFEFGDPHLFTDVNGRFTIQHLNPAVPGRYFIMIDQPGFQPLKQEASFGAEQRFQLLSGEKLVGTVLNEETGQPMADAHLFVMAFPSKPGEFHGIPTAKSDSQGRFEFTQLDHREYSLNCRQGKVVNPKEGRVVAGQDEQLVIRIKPHTPAPAIRL